MKEDQRGWEENDKWIYKLTGSVSVRLSFHTSSRATTISWSSSRDRIPSRSTSNTLKQTVRETVMPGWNPNLDIKLCTATQTLFIALTLQFTALSRNLICFYCLRITATKKKEATHVRIKRFGIIRAKPLGWIYLTMLTFLPFSHWPPAAGRESTGDLFKVNVIVPILIKGMKQAWKKWDRQ